MFYESDIGTLESAITHKNRVIVQLNKPGSQNCSLSKLSIAQAKVRPDHADPYVAVGYSTLLVNLNSSNSNLQVPALKLQFDCVGNGFDANTRSEMGTMMDRLLMRNRNCCMIRCVGKRELSAAILNHLMVCEVDTRCRTANLNVTSITCEYYDLRKFEVVNLIGGAESRKFMNTMDIQRWLNGEYQELASCCQGHECLDFTFSYTDRSKESHTVKFCYMQVVADRLNLTDKMAFSNCLSSNGRQKSTNSTLVDTLRDTLLPKNATQLWMFFDVTMEKNGGVNEMLMFAEAAYNGFNKRRRFFQL